MALVNRPSLAGQLAAPKELFGPDSRYAVAPIHTRFSSVEWYVWDAEQTDDVTGLLDVIRQESSREKAMKGLA